MIDTHIGTKTPSIIPKVQRKFVCISRRSSSRRVSIWSSRVSTWFSLVSTPFNLWPTCSKTPSTLASLSSAMSTSLYHNINFDYYHAEPLGFPGLSLRAFFPRHCEEQSDEAISGKPVDLGQVGSERCHCEPFPFVIARHEIPRLSLRGTASRSNLWAGSEQAPQSLSYEPGKAHLKSKMRWNEVHIRSLCPRSTGDKAILEERRT